MSELSVGTNLSDTEEQVRAAVESYLERAFDNYPASAVREAARYSVLGGGRRWRAIVAVAAGQIFRPDALQVTLPGACGVELAHSASLVLDDLPSMDDAKLRRGKPCTHIAFPEWAVDLTPIFLVTMAYQISLANSAVPEEQRVRAALELSAAGLQMIAGQAKDVLQAHASQETERDLIECYHLKTGVLYAVAAKVGAILCGASASDAKLIYFAGLNLGLSFQMLDDVLDARGSAEVQKQSEPDAQKWTAVDWLGVEGAMHKSRQYQLLALSALRSFGKRADPLRAAIRDATTPLASI